MFNLGSVMKDLGDRERARPIYEEVLRRARELPSARTQALALGNLASLAHDEGRYDDAVPLSKEALRFDHELGELRLAARDLARFAIQFAREGRAATAARLLSSSDELRRRIGAGDDTFEETLQAIRAELGPEEFAEAWEAGRMLTLDEAVELALGESG